MAGFTLGGDFLSDLINRAMYRASMPLFAPKYRIVIDCDGKDTTAFMYVNGEIVKSTGARLSPSDKFSLPIGTRVAFERLWEKKPKDTEATK